MADPNSVRDRLMALEARVQRTEALLGQLLETPMVAIFQKFHDLEERVEKWGKSMDEIPSFIEGRMVSLAEDISILTDAVDMKLDAVNVEISVLKRATGSVVSGDGGPSSKLRVSDPKSFGGERSAKELENFLWDMETYFQVARVSDAEKVSMASMFLVGDAKLWWRSRVSDDVATNRGRIETWEALKKGIEGTIPPLQFVVACKGVPAKFKAYRGAADGLVDFSGIEVRGSETKQRGTGNGAGNFTKGDSKNQESPTSANKPRKSCFIFGSLDHRMRDGPKRERLNALMVDTNKDSSESAEAARLGGLQLLNAIQILDEEDAVGSNLKRKKMDDDGDSMRTSRTSSLIWLLISKGNGTGDMLRVNPEKDGPAWYSGPEIGAEDGLARCSGVQKTGSRMVRLRTEVLKLGLRMVLLDTQVLKSGGNGGGFGSVLMTRALCCGWGGLTMVPGRSIPSVNNNEISDSADNSSKIFKDIDYFVLRDNNNNVEFSDPRIELSLSVSSILSSTRDRLVHNVGRRVSVDITMEEQDEGNNDMGNIDNNNHNNEVNDLPVDSEGNSEVNANLFVFSSRKVQNASWLSKSSKVKANQIAHLRIDEMLPPLPHTSDNANKGGVALGDGIQPENVTNPILVDSTEGSDVRAKGFETSARVRPRIVLTSQAKKRATAELQRDALSGVRASIPSENFELLDRMEAFSLQERFETFGGSTRLPLDTSRSLLKSDWRVYIDSSIDHEPKHSVASELFSNILLTRDKAGVMSRHHTDVEDEGFYHLTKAGLHMHHLSLGVSLWKSEAGKNNIRVEE
ncbi:hypothetical protein BUALT_Bualt02G0159100 [Buddleja alternifolia]|uniref:Retrotransposon gag domain-containing protein n=1 Tax=Buddleja alternifolia TaxID=168488 RepID=A0AAV6YBB1_9LAMI|nr:hypothetical protein BUALT_Bualt02G0159100 [Buddleja alternifolia]